LRDLSSLSITKVAATRNVPATCKMADSFNTMPEPSALSSFRAFAIAFEWPLHARCSTVTRRSEALKSRMAMVVVGHAVERTCIQLKPRILSRVTASVSKLPIFLSVAADGWVASARNDVGVRDGEDRGTI
jgi:hypothetical protein